MIFICYSTPSDKWERYTAEMPIYLDLNATLPSDTTVSTNLGPKPDRCAFWNRILPKISKNLQRQNPVNVDDRAKKISTEIGNTSPTNSASADFVDNSNDYCVNGGAELKPSCQLDKYEKIVPDFEDEDDNEDSEGNSFWPKH